jgi:hypothetical protein
MLCKTAESVDLSHWFHTSRTKGLAERTLAAITAVTEAEVLLLVLLLLLVL